MNYSKTDVRYWREVIYRQHKSGRAGKKVPYGDWTVRIAHGGQRETFPLGTLNREIAATKAKEIFLFVQANGVKAASTVFKKEVEQACLVSVGDLIAQAKEHLDVRPKTFGGYARALRKIVADIEGIEDQEGKKFDYRTGGRDKWLAQVDSVKLSKLTPERISVWRTAFVARHQGDKRAERSARISANSFVREARSLFSPEVLKHLNLSGSGLKRLPFEGITTGARLPMRYRSSVDDIEVLIADACRELNVPERRESFKIFCLAALAGLRRGEIDKLEWPALDFDRGILRLGVTKYFAGKSESSLGDIPLDPELVALFRGFKAQAKGNFVIEAQPLPNLKAGYSHYRAAPAFELLIKWLRAHGISGNSPIHALRKEFGSAMVRKHGIFAASQALRHSDISVTREHYTDDEKARVSVGLGHLLPNSGNIIPIQQKNTTQRQIVG
jgi:integrase